MVRGCLDCKGYYAMILQPGTRPALIAKNPQRIREALRPWGVSIRTLALDTYHGTLTIPPTTPPLIFDVRGLPIGEAARRLCALQRYQRQTKLIPQILVDAQDTVTQQLIASCVVLRAAILDANQPDTLVAWLWAPLDLAPNQIWVNVPKPLARQHPSCAQLIAALDGAVSIEHAALRCAIAPNTAYRILQSYCGVDTQRRSVEDWREALAAALGG
jgi:hypothetical protein